MDPELLRQKIAFQKHAATTVAVQNKPSAAASSHTTYSSEAAKAKKKKASGPTQNLSKLPDFDNFASNSNAISNATNFSTMAKIVDYMKKRHLSQQQWPLTLKEVLDELQLYDLGKRNIAFLQEALPNNPRLMMEPNPDGDPTMNKFAFRPPYKIKGKTSLVAVARKHYQDGKGGILVSDLAECVANYDALLQQVAADVIVVPTQVNKKKDRVVFYNDKDFTFPELEDDFKALWRNVSVDHLDEKKIEEYLQKKGLDAMKDLTPKVRMQAPLKRKAAKRRHNQKVQNDHMEGVLEDYE
ncbi:unnamed protein product [Caenorhabditis nigoni]|uniref:Transcription initiation factor IIE subunit beta n=1 Tax=Caenorhabditis nigoni TaxID=1611254 RepID=A0A2G5V2U1_9PELO|nr:hypothetical protein B9Z55_005908 [Caenorhabditis nigoni]